MSFVINLFKDDKGHFILVKDKASLDVFLLPYKSALIQHPFLGPGHDSSVLKTMVNASFPRVIKNSDFWANSICSIFFEPFDGFDATSEDFGNAIGILLAVITLRKL